MLPLRAKSNGMCSETAEYCATVEDCRLNNRSARLEWEIYIDDCGNRRDQPSGTSRRPYRGPAWLSNPNTKVPASELPGVIAKIHGALVSLSSSASVEAAQSQPEFTPAVWVRRLLASKDHIISLIDGKPYKMLRRHLSGHGLTPDQYRERYGLKPDYPMVSETYSEVRRTMAKKIGLGRKPGAKAKPTKPARRSRKSAAEKQSQP